MKLTGANRRLNGIQRAGGGGRLREQLEQHRGPQAVFRPLDILHAAEEPRRNPAGVALVGNQGLVCVVFWEQSQETPAEGCRDPALYRAATDPSLALLEGDQETSELAALFDVAQAGARRLPAFETHGAEAFERRKALAGLCLAGEKTRPDRPLRDKREARGPRIRRGRAHPTGIAGRHFLPSTRFPP